MGDVINVLGYNSSADFVVQTRHNSTLSEKLRITSDGNLRIPADNAQLQIGASNDLVIFHDGTSSHLQNGTNDFSLFSKNNPDIENKVCTIYLSEWSEVENKLVYEIHGNRFLHHMVRYLVGTMVEVAKGKLSIEDFMMKKKR